MTLSADTLLGAVIKGLTPSEALISVRQLALERGSVPGCPHLYGKLLMACEAEQAGFLTHLWDHFTPDKTVMIMWMSIVKAGFFIDCLEVKGPRARALLALIQTTMDLTAQHTPAEHICARCKRSRM